MKVERQGRDRAASRLSFRLHLSSFVFPLTPALSRGEREFRRSEPHPIALPISREPAGPVQCRTPEGERMRAGTDVKPIFLGLIVALLAAAPSPADEARPRADHWATIRP